MRPRTQRVGDMQAGHVLFGLNMLLGEQAMDPRDQLPRELEQILFRRPQHLTLIAAASAVTTSKASSDTWSLSSRTSKYKARPDY